MFMRFVLLQMLLSVTFTKYVITFKLTNDKLLQLTGTFWHVTDFHWDTNYTEIGGDVTKMCWASNNTDPSVNVGAYGNYACDSPWTLVQSTLNFMKNSGKQPDFVIWTGDDSAHVSDSNFSLDKVIEIMGNITNAIKQYFPTTPVIPVFGNHDAYPKSNLPPKESELYVRVADLWKDWLKDGYTTFQKGGYYTIPHPTVPNTIIVGLNTPLYYQKNALVSSNMTDPNGQFAWLDLVLTNAASKNQKAYIVSHVPPGIFGRKVTSNGYPWFRAKFNKRYLSIILKHADTIIGQFYGHDHTDSFKLYYDSQGTPVNAHFTAPAVTPWNTTLSGIGPNNPGVKATGSDPAVRLFSYNLTFGNIINYEQYYLNLTEANNNNIDNWQLEYDFLKDYNLPDMTYASIDKLAQTFATSDRTYFNKYYMYDSVSATDASECDSVCQRNNYCAIVKVDYDEFALCNNVTTVIEEPCPCQSCVHSEPELEGQSHHKRS